MSHSSICHSSMSHNSISHNSMSHNFMLHSSIGHNSFCHKSMSHNSISHKPKKLLKEPIRMDSLGLLNSNRNNRRYNYRKSNYFYLINLFNFNILFYLAFLTFYFYFNI